MGFKQKLEKHGRIEKYKYRLAAQGFRQVKGVHYAECSSPTPAQASIRMVSGIIATQGCDTYQLNVDMAYLKGDVEEILRESGGPPQEDHVRPHPRRPALVKDIRSGA